MFSDLVLKVLDPSFDVAPRRYSNHSLGDFAAQGIQMDIKETDTQYEIIADLPGVSKDQAKLEVKDHVLTISYERAMVEKGEGETYHRMERFYGSATRSIRLPRNVDEDKVAATFNNGVLSVVIQKLPTAQPKTINIH
jgi:HSP20 family protein